MCYPPLGIGLLLPSTLWNYSRFMFKEMPIKSYPDYLRKEIIYPVFQARWCPFTLCTHSHCFYFL